MCINKDRLLADFEALAEIGATVDGGITRLALSNEDLEARAWFADRIDSAGLFVRDDDVGNLSGVLFCEDTKARTLIVGSHLDSVPNGGRFDGAVGVLAALECARVIQENSIRLPLHLEIIDFTDEEGCWQSLFGSRGLTGRLDMTHTADRNIDQAPFRAALFRAGIRPADAHNARRDPSTIAGYLELHIEQGYRLDRLGVDIGVVTGIVGRSTYHVTFHGRASHSGTTEISERRDALLGASSFICKAHQVWLERYPEGVFNCGNAVVSPGAFNVIPDETLLTVEVRHFDADVLSEMETVFLDMAREEAERYNLTLDTHRVSHFPAAPMAARMVEAVTAICQREDIAHTPLVSYAGHDAQMMAGFTDSGMIFIPSVGGISHSPQEFTHWEQVVQGANVLLQTILFLAQSPRNEPVTAGAYNGSASG